MIPTKENNPVNEALINNDAKIAISFGTLK